jgi:hypothetical protein
MEINFLPPLPANAGVITAVQPDNPLSLALAGSPALPLGAHAQAGAVVRGTVQQRLPQGMIVLDTELGALTIKTDVPLKRGAELAIKIEQVKDTLIARIIAIDGKSFAKYQEMHAQQATAAVMDEINPSSALTQSVTPAALPKSGIVPSPLATTVTATMPYTNVAHTRLEPVSVPDIPDDNMLTPLTSTPLRGVLLQPPTLTPALLSMLPPSLHVAMQQAQAGTALQIIVQNVALPPALPAEEGFVPTLSASVPPVSSASPPAGAAVNAPAASVPIAPVMVGGNSAVQPPLSLPASLPVTPPLSVQPALNAPVVSVSPASMPTASPPVTSAVNITTPASPLPLKHFTATVLHQSNPRELTVQTPFGMMKLFTPTALPKGTVIVYELVQLEQVRGGALPSVMEAHSIPARLGALEEIAELTHVHPTPVPPHLQGHIVPRPGVTLASDILFLLTALQGNGGVKQWLGDALYSHLSSRDEKGTLMPALAQDFAALKQLPTDVRDGQWHHVLVPLNTEGEVRPIQLFFKKQKGNMRSKQPHVDHFLLEVELTRLGVMQLDGLVQKHPNHTQFDMMVRAAQPWDAEIEQQISRIFYDAQAAMGMVGSVHFYYGKAHMLAYPDTARDTFLVDVADNSLIV